MSLDVTLTEDVAYLGVASDFLRDHGFEDAADYLTRMYNRGGDDVYEANITHNLGRMAREAGIYEACWRPEEIGATRARQLIEPLRVGLAKLKSDPDHFRTFDAENGWGTYDVFVPWVESYLRACEAHPDAIVKADR